MKKIKYCLLALLCPYMIWAQTTLVPLDIGDAMPDLRLERLINNTTPYYKISDLKARVLIIDFWASWCGACIKGFDKLANLQKHYKKDLEVLLVNTAGSGDDLNKVQSVIQKRKLPDGRSIPFPILYMDTVFDQLFPHQSIPHYIWIVDGQIASITNGDELTIENVEALLNGNAGKLNIKRDQDKSKPLFSNDALPAGQLLYYSILTKGKFSGLGSGNKLRRTGTIVHGRAITNSTLLYMYQATGQALIHDFSHKRMVINVSESALLVSPKDKEELEAWRKDNLYNYDIIVPPQRAHRLYYDMLEDLNRYTGYKAIVKDHLSGVWVLSVDHNLLQTGLATGPKKNMLRHNGHPCLQNGSMQDLVRYLDKLEILANPVIDETGYRGNLNICLAPGIQDLKSLKKSLSSCGIQLQYAERKLPMMIITESN